MHAGPVPGKEHQVLAVAHDKVAVVTGRRERGGHAASTAAADRALSGFAADPAVLHLVGLRHAKGATADWASDRQGQRIERGGHPLVDRLLDGQLVVPSAKVLDERVPGDDHLGAAVLLEPEHRS
jgi:hypothetical protein